MFSGFMSRWTRQATAAALVVALAGCQAALTAPFRLRCPNVPEARISRDGQALAVARNGLEATILLERDRDHVLEVSADGFAKKTVLVTSGTSGFAIFTMVVSCLVVPIVFLPIVLPTWIATEGWLTLDPMEAVIALDPSGEGIAAETSTR